MDLPGGSANLHVVGLGLCVPDLASRTLDRLSFVAYFLPYLSDAACRWCAVCVLGPLVYVRHAMLCVKSRSGLLSYLILVLRPDRDYLTAVQSVTVSPFFVAKRGLIASG